MYRYPLLLCVMLLIGAATVAQAATTTGLPWESAMDTIKESLTGPIPLAISLIGICIAGGTLIFGGELGQFARSAVMLTMVIALLVGSGSILTTLFGASSTLVL